MDETGELRNQITAALQKAGAFCGECGWQPGDEGCADCKRHWDWCADALMPLFAAEREAAYRDGQAQSPDESVQINGVRYRDAATARAAGAFSNRPSKAGA